MSSFWTRALGGAAALAASAGHLPLSYAQTTAVQTGNWGAPATWSAGEPTSAALATIDGAFNVTVDQAGEVAAAVDIGNAAAASGTLTIAAGGALNIPNGGPLPSIRVGQAAGGAGTFDVTGGTVTINGPAADSGFAIGDLLVGDNGNGTMTQSGGSVTVSDELVVGTQPASTSTLSISAGTLSTQRRSILVGFAGNGTLNVSGTADVTANFDLLVGFQPGSTGAVNVSGGTITAGIVFTNSFTGGIGSTVTMTQTGGTVNTRVAYVLGQGRGTSSLTHSGGTINALTNNGDMVVSDGTGNTSTYDVSGTAAVNLLHNFIVGAFEGANGTVNQTGGTITAGDNLFIGRDGVGAWNLSGGTTNARQAFLGDFDTSSGTMVVSGGTLNLSGNLSVGGALASNAPPAPVGDQGQALDAEGTLTVRGTAGDINVGGNLLANDGDHIRRRPDLTGDNVSKLNFEVLAGGVSRIDVTGIADLTGAEINVDLVSGLHPAGSFFDLITATDISTDYIQTAADVGVISLAIVAGGNGEILRATVVPEPATAALSTCVVVAFGARRRRSA
jgi:hypothetical protein